MTTARRATVRVPGYLTSAASRLDTKTATATAGDHGVVTDRAAPGWVLRRLDAALRVQVEGGAGGLFVAVEPLLGGCGGKRVGQVTAWP